jgi:F0F1-type ATP synthase assembly protein I
MNKDKDKDKNPKKKLPNAFLKYSGMSTKIALAILAGVYSGKYLDEYFGLETPIFTLVLSMLGLALALYIIIRDTRQ